MSGGSLTPEGHHQEIEEAAKTFDIIRSNETTVLLDLDTPSSLEQFQRVLPKVRAEFGVVSVEGWKSKSGNEHVRVTLSEPQSMAVRIALQAALGSDGVREVLAVKRMLNGCVEPSVLFKPREVAVG